MGTVLVIISNASFIYAALADKEVDNAVKTLLTVLNGVGSAAGRLMMSYFEVWVAEAQAEDRVSIVVSVYFADVFVILSLVLFLVDAQGRTAAAVRLGCHGQRFWRSIHCVGYSDDFCEGPRQALQLYFLFCGVSTILLNRLLYGEWYTGEAEKQGGNVALAGVV
ncbi:hypothetical protein TcYC6_0082480 [Trypanosoma cruzi]|nr:hypothetical protein TcYC6_0082480 [Trypanosoma cruzi]